MPATSRFLLLGEPLALDLVNTRVRRNGANVDLLDTPSALSAWLRAERERVAWMGAADGADLEAVLTLRDAIDRLLRARRARTQPPRISLNRVNQALSSKVARGRLCWSATGPFLKPPSARARRDALLGMLAADALTLLAGPEAGRVRECAHADCILQFVTRNRRRIWCSGASCGNRSRVAKHYERSRQAV